MCTARLFSRRQVIVANFKVIPAMLSTGAVALNRAAFGQGTGSIVEVYCGYTDKRITDCNIYDAYGWCSHRHDAGVRCCE
jgi:hypothetical protein